jgi:phosphatidylglycerophosphatase A
LSSWLADLRGRYAARGVKGGPPPEGPPGFWTVLAAWGPCGFSPVAPGTVGTAGAVPLAWAVARLEPGPAALAGLALLALSVVAATRAGRYWRVVDASPIVIDEVVGYLVTMAFVPFTWPAAAAGFLLFRICDIAKPWPASAFDRIKSGLGVVLDDVAAGVWAGAGLWLLWRLAPGVLS